MDSRKWTAAKWTVGNGQLEMDSRKWTAAKWTVAKWTVEEMDSWEMDNPFQPPSPLLGNYRKSTPLSIIGLFDTEGKWG